MIGTVAAVTGLSDETVPMRANRTERRPRAVLYAHLLAAQGESRLLEEPTQGASSHVGGESNGEGDGYRDRDIGKPMTYLASHRTTAYEGSTHAMQQQDWIGRGGWQQRYMLSVCRYQRRTYRGKQEKAGRKQGSMSDHYRPVVVQKALLATLGHRIPGCPLQVCRQGASKWHWQLANVQLEGRQWAHWMIGGTRTCRLPDCTMHGIFIRLRVAPSREDRTLGVCAIWVDRGSDPGVKWRAMVGLWKR